MHTPPSFSPAVAAAPRQSALRTALAGLIGNVLEWFDFAVYGYFATEIGRQFFPRSDPTAQQLLAFAVFALGFLARPFGSLVLGRVGDRIGRRALLTLSIVLMGGATLIVGLLPTYQQVGVAAPILLIAMRVVQGFSLGGEFTGSMVYTTEQASPMMRGLISSSTAPVSVGPLADGQPRTSTASPSSAAGTVVQTLASAARGLIVGWADRGPLNQCASSAGSSGAASARRPKG